MRSEGRGDRLLPGYEWHAPAKRGVDLRRLEEEGWIWWFYADWKKRVGFGGWNCADWKIMFYVYILRSQAAPKQVYTGFTEDLRQRLADHNEGRSTHTKKFMPWALETYVGFADREQALAFERYLKTASGVAFARKRLHSFADRRG